MKSLPLINPKQEANKIISFLKKTFKEQKIDKVVFGLSGGIDSTTVLYLLKRVLPKKNIYAVQMDYNPRKKSKIDLEEVNVVDVSIKKIVDDLKGSIPKFFDGKQQTLPAGRQAQTNLVSSPFGKDEANVFFSLSRGAHPTEGREGRDSRVIKNTLTSLTFDKIRLGNIMARVRMIILFDLAKQLGALVCGTENKSERLLGYFTRFGDSASDIEPLSHLYKTQIYQLAKYLKVPEKIIDQSPTAGLWNGQTDEDEFGFSYLEADQVLYLIHGRRQDINQIKKKFPNAEKIIKRLKDNQFKLKTPYSL